MNGATSTYAYDHAGNRVLQTTSASTTAYASKSYSVTDGIPTKHIFAGDLLVATVEGSTPANTTRYIHVDHLTGSSVVSSATGTVVEVLDYYPYGDIRTDEKVGEYSETRKFAGHEYDVADGLSYMGARYYDGNLGRFLSEDPMFLAIGTDLRKYGKTQDEILADPQQMNAYSYARNNPLVYVDSTGQASTLAWMMNPIATAAQVLVWKLGALGLNSGLLMRGGSGMGATAALLQHSVSLNPGAVSITSQNQKDYGNIVDKIVGSSEYQGMADRFIQSAEAKGLTSADSASVNIPSSVIFESDNDLKASIHNVGINLQGNRNSDGTWNINTNISDTYDFKAGGYSDPFLGAANNAAVASQATGAVSNYSVGIQFTDKRAKKK